MANNSFKPTPCRGVGHVLCATLARVRHPAKGRLNSGVRRHMKRIATLFQRLLKFGMPAYLVLLPAIAIFGWLAPWAPAQSLLASRSDQTPLLVGASYRNHYSLGSSRSVISSRSYILLPAVLTDPQVVTLTKENDADVTVSESRSAFFCMLAWFVVCVAGTWWFWFRRVPPNNSFKPTPLRGAA